MNYIRGGTVNYIRGGTVNTIRGGTVNTISGGTVNTISGGTVCSFFNPLGYNPEVKNIKENGVMIVSRDNGKLKIRTALEVEVVK